MGGVGDGLVREGREKVGPDVVVGEVVGGCEDLGDAGGGEEEALRVHA